MLIALVVFLLTSIAAAKYRRAWLWLQVYLPCVRLVSQPTRMCVRIPGVVHHGTAGSSPEVEIAWRVQDVICGSDGKS